MKDIIVASNQEGIQSFKIKELFESNEQYIIPIYQRNYAWGKAQVTQLIQDIVDVSKENKTYYIGTLVVYKRDGSDTGTLYETIDGQQRLTTLSILLSVLKHRGILDFTPHKILSFESREISKNTINDMYNRKDFLSAPEIKKYNATMKQAYIDIKNKLDDMKCESSTFVEFLLNNVEILRVGVPEDTDLNHYFEIMNNRGEQLEKHEVLKAQMMSQLENDQERLLFAKIWDACSDMSRYVQYGFLKEDREYIFSAKWDDFQLQEFDDILKTQKSNENKRDDSLSLESIIKADNISVTAPNDKGEKDFERFVSPINFQNFLLHVLRVQVGGVDDTIALDDKRLLDQFEPYKNREFIKKFVFNLLKMKYIFDNFILKRDYSKNSDDGEWSLRKLFYGSKSAQYNNTFNDENNRKIIMLLSMFHVSNPSQNYKHWLSAVLNYLFHQDTIDNLNETEYIKYLEKLARYFLKNRYLANNESSYSEIIFSKTLELNSDINRDNLNQGTKVENFIFNYLDYLLWKNEKGNYKNFSFSFKSSVEHVYPQHPKDGQVELEKEVLDSFGNLCLISATKNSELSNYMPTAKKEHYFSTGYDSLKQELMMYKAEKWDESTIKEHQIEMEEILFNGESI